MINPPFSPDQGQKSIYIAIPKQPYQSTTFINVNTLFNFNYKSSYKNWNEYSFVVLFLDACSIFMVYWKSENTCILIYWFSVWIRLKHTHCKDKIPKFRNKYSQKKKNRGLSPNFHIHASVSNLYLPTIGQPFLLEEICIDRSWAEAALFPEKEHINGIFVAVHTQAPACILYTCLLGHLKYFCIHSLLHSLSPVR